MNKFFIFLMLLTVIIFTTTNAKALNINYVNGSTPYKNYQNSNPYSEDLTMVESYLFGYTYRNESNDNRLLRIEKRLFNRTFTSMAVTQRMNNILTNYRNDYKNYCNTVPNRPYYTSNNYYNGTNLRNRLINTFVGQPTGYTPQILNSDYIKNYGPSYTRGFYGTNGWGYNNTYQPTMTGAGVTILD